MKHEPSPANPCSRNIKPLAIPSTMVIARPILKVTSFGCAVIIFMILPFNDIFNQ